MPVRKIGRRWMLLGGGAALLVPALPSLLPRGSRGQAQDTEPPRRMVVMMSEHGGIWQPFMYPDEAEASETFSHPLHPCHRGALTSRTEGGERVMTELLRAPEAAFTASIASKMNLLRGLDVPFYYGHGRHLLGNYGDMSNNHDEVTPEQQTADVVMAYSDAVYPTPPRRRLMNFGFDALSVELRDRMVGPSGGFQPVEEVSVQSIWDSVYVPPMDGETPRPAPIDAVYESYRRLESGAFGAGARLGRADRQRLTQYMDRLSDLRAAVSAMPGAMCSDVMPIAELPGRWDSRYGPESASVIHDVIVAAFMCDSSRVAVIRTTHPFSDAMESDGGYHEVAHNAAGGGGSVTDEGTLRRLHGLLLDGNRTFFRDGFLDLVGKLDAVSDGEGTMLDHSLVWWAQEAGSVTHNGDSIPVVTAGSAGGRLAVGQYYDLRDRRAEAVRGGQFGNEGRRRGACFFQWTTTYLDAFGVPRSEWQVPERRAFSAMGPNHTWMAMQYDLGALDASCDSALPLLLG